MEIPIEILMKSFFSYGFPRVFLSCTGAPVFYHWHRRKTPSATSQAFLPSSPAWRDCFGDVQRVPGVPGRRTRAGEVTSWCGGFHSHGGTPIAGWFIVENPNLNGWLKIMGVSSSSWGYPTSYHPFVDGIFHEINHPFGGDPPVLETSI